MNGDAQADERVLRILDLAVAQDPTALKELDAYAAEGGWKGLFGAAAAWAVIVAYDASIETGQATGFLVGPDPAGRPPAERRAIVAAGQLLAALINREDATAADVFAAAIKAGDGTHTIHAVLAICANTIQACRKDAPRG